jgi:ubiquinone/menaquinone biosynthesis C-methylase UbiE/DNA-binding HxlR family transcriptional regulator
VASLLKALRLLGEESRLRILRLLSREELSVAELQHILGMGQSRISMQLSQLKQAGLVEVRRAGQKSLYRLVPHPETESVVREVLRRSATEIRDAPADEEGLELVLRRRKDTLRSYFDELAGRFGKSYVPGRSWKGTAEMLLKLLPPLVIADLGAGEGTLGMMLAQRATRVIAVDSSEKMVEYGRSVAERNGVRNLDYRVGDLEDLPIADEEIDLALLHQSLHHALHPQKAVDEAWRILRPGGRVVILDLLKHGFEEARDLYADVWLGFSQVEVMGFLRDAKFGAPDVSIVHRENETPHFETVLALASK